MRYFRSGFQYTLILFLSLSLAFGLELEISEENTTVTVLPHGPTFEVSGNTIDLPSVGKIELKVSKPGFNDYQAVLSGGNKKEIFLTKDYVDPLTGMKMIYVPAGSFIMGSPMGGENKDAPLHPVQISKGFYLGKYEVTQKEWRDVMGSDTWTQSPSYKADSPKNPVGIGDNYPVSWLSWHDTQKFIEKLNARAGKKIYRLPTEAEFEYAAKAGTNSYYIGGDRPEDICRYGNVADLSGKKFYPHWQPAPCDDGYPTTSPVGKFIPNPWGFHDMIGNVWSWIHDWYDPEYFLNSPAKDPKGPRNGKDKIKKGGCYFGNHRHVRVGDRFFNVPEFRWCFMGFRLLREASSPLGVAQPSLSDLDQEPPGAPAMKAPNTGSLNSPKGEKFETPAAKRFSLPNEGPPGE